MTGVIAELSVTLNQQGEMMRSPIEKPLALRAFSVILALGMALLVTPAEASRNIGSGVVRGTVQFDAPGLPPGTATCQPASFRLEHTYAPAFVLNTVITGYAGEITITGQGVATCGSTLGSGGTLTLTVTGTGPTGSQIDCATLDGTFDRTATLIRVTLFGSCTVNQYGTAPIQFLADLQFTPLPPGAGVTSPVLTAKFDGAFVVVPANS